MTAPAFVHELYIKTTPEELWKALTQTDYTSRYFYGTHVTSDWKVGSPVHFRDGDGRDQIEGKVLAAEPRKRLVLSQRYLWDPAMAKEEPSRIAYDIEPQGETCRLTVTQDGSAEGSAAYAAMLRGWPWIVSGLKTLLETGQSLPGAGPA